MLANGYCERIGSGLWDEPWNALTNGAFLLAAFAALVLWRRAGGNDRLALAMVLLVLAIGIGSFLFHTMPRPWTLAADVVPIQLFAFSYFGLALARFIGLRPVATGLGTLAFFGFALLLSWGLAPLLPLGLRGSAGYAAFLLGLAGMAGALWRQPGKADTARLIGLAGLVFAISLTFRTLDGPLCGSFPLGTHWLWHLLNATVLYLLLRAAIMHGPGRAADRQAVAAAIVQGYDDGGRTSHAPRTGPDLMTRRARILVINPNSNEAVTEGLRQAVLPLSYAEGPEIICETLTEGPFGVETQEHAESVTIPLRRKVEAANDVDAFVIACYSDPGLHVAREGTTSPVFGIAESGVLTALARADRFGVIAIKTRSIPRHIRYLRQMGLMDRLAGERPLEMSVAETASGDRTLERMIAIGRELKEIDGAGAIVMGCAGMARHRRPLEQELGIPVIDPTQAAVAMAIGTIAVR